MPKKNPIIEFIREVISVFYYMTGQITPKKDDSGETIYVLNQMMLRTYPTVTAPSIVVSDYTSSIRYNGKNPIISGKCNITTEQQAVVMQKALSRPDMTYDFLEKYRNFFTEGFIVANNTVDIDKLSHILAPNMKPVGAKVLWKVKYAD